MIRTTAAPRTVRVGAAVACVAGAIALAGCSVTHAPATADASGGYTDGTYTAEGTYSTPESVETITVTVTLEDDVITDVEVAGDPQKPESKEYQSRFIGGISAVVVGKDIDEISVSRVAGSSLTSSGFNQAIQAIKDQASA